MIENMYHHTGDYVAHIHVTWTDIFPILMGFILIYVMSAMFAWIDDNIVNQCKEQNKK